MDEKTLNDWLLDFSTLDNSPLHEDEKRRLNRFLSDLEWAPYETRQKLFEELGYYFELYNEPIIQRAVLRTAEYFVRNGVHSYQYKESRAFQELCGFVVKFVDLFNFYREERERGGNLESCEYYATRWTEQIVILEGYFERVDAYFQRFAKQYPQENVEDLTSERNSFEYDIKRFRTVVNNTKKSCARKTGASAMTLEIDLLNGFVKKLIAREVINYYLEDKARRLERAEQIKSTSELAEMLRG